MNPDDPRRWLLLGREAGIPDQAEGANRWAVDHVFLDHDAVPTFVEVKRSSDTRIRREVVGQMLDYVANAVAFWTVETLQSLLERERTDGGQSQDGVLSDFIGADGDADDFW
jgi:hypothetical protein